MSTLMALLQSVINFLPSLNLPEAVLVWIVAGSGFLSGLMTVVNLIWQALVKFLQGLALLPGLSNLSHLANTLMVDEQNLESFENSYLIPVLNILSTIIPIPSTNKSLKKKE